MLAAEPSLPVVPMEVVRMEVVHMEVVHLEVEGSEWAAEGLGLAAEVACT